MANIAAVYNGGTPPGFTINVDHWATELTTYHWNDGIGAPGGTIALRSDKGETYGPWPVEVRTNWYWVATPNTWLPAGTYSVLDSDPSTWAQNAGTAGKGMAWMQGIPADAAPQPAPTPPR